ncbi:MAG TPA: hypothetical protein VF101_09265 [Gaiellaceae bacterium]
MRYVCALFAELAYHHLPRMELDPKRMRAKLVPSYAYQALVKRGRATDVTAYLPGAIDSQDAFAVTTDRAVAVGVRLGNEWFIGFRGTKLLYGADWFVNGKFRLVAAGSSPARSGPGRFHSGFAHEAARISAKVIDAVKASSLPNPAQVFLTGHSLGGAVAAISHDHLRFGPTAVCLFGAPRYGDRNAYANAVDPCPTQIRRRGDEVPTVPPKWLGYADPPLALAPDGTMFVDPSFLGKVVALPKFFAHFFHQHSMESYRHDLGRVAGATEWRKPLTDFDRL